MWRIGHGRSLASCLGLVLMLLCGLRAWSDPDLDERLLATSSVTGPGYSQAPVGQQILTTKHPKSLVAMGEDSLWAALLLNFAAQRDPELAKIARKQTALNSLIFGNVVALAGLNAGQSIPFLTNPNSSLTARRVMGVIGSGMLLAGAGVQGILEGRYNRRATRRLNELKAQICIILGRLTQGEEPEQVRDELIDLVGPLASEEFLTLWRATHPSSLQPLAMPLEID